ncbi:hypothetical protein O9K63_03340 [Janibacter cremeus]|uniref:hypothetical protein n=1 Tax=Janibacter cremeus TaxID=1285192 RepID=UPI0023FA13E0|nr:hypothetical protein [Janibacter cremeus]WEV78843.1 hypothetical protein O9K63_03340 [Janibacter cremeus]
MDRYLHSQHRGRTRAWAEHTAWGAVALLAGRDADWLGATQRSRLRQSLRAISDVDDLVPRMRDRARVCTFEAHRAALPRLRDLIVVSNTSSLGITEAIDGSVDGYLAAGDLDRVVVMLGLRADPGGAVTLRVTSFDFARARELVTTPVTAALDAATSTDPRMRGIGNRALHKLLKAYR